MKNVLTPSMKINEKLKVVPYDCLIVDNMRIMIKTRINEQSNRKAVVIGINPSKACEGKSDTTLTKISKYLYQYEIGEIAMINLFETISTEQEGIDFSQECTLEKHEQILEESDVIVVAWGTEDKYLEAKDKAFRYLLQWKDKVYCIQDKNGNKPRHPSRIAYADALVRYYPDENQKYPVVTLCESTRLKTVKGDITKIQDVQAIVNAANTSLLGGGGVDGAIHRAAGPELLEECRTLHGCETGKAKITKAYNLPCDYVIHTVGPIWNNGKNKEEELLASCYYNSMKVALENGIRTIAFPSISTGVYHFPVELAAKIAVHTVERFLKENENSFDLVEWVLFDDNTEKVYEKEVEDVRFNNMII